MAVIRISMGQATPAQPQRAARPAPVVNMGQPAPVQPQRAARPAPVVNMGQPAPVQPVPAAAASNLKEMLFGAAALGAAAACTIIGAKVAWGLLTEKENASADNAQANVQQYAPPPRYAPQANIGSQAVQPAPAPKIVYEQQPTTIVYKQPQRVVYEERVVVPQRVVYENRVVVPQPVMVAPPSVSIGVGIGSGGFAMGASMVQPGGMSALFQDPLIYGPSGYYAPGYYSGSSVAIGFYHGGHSRGHRVVNNNYYCRPVARTPRQVVAPRPRPVPPQNNGRVRH